MRDLLAGVGGPLRDVVLLNSGAALLDRRARRRTSRAGIELAARSLDSGAARRVLDELVARTNAPVEAEATADEGRARRDLRREAGPCRARARRRCRRQRCSPSSPRRRRCGPSRRRSSGISREGRYGLIAEIKKASPERRADPRRFRSVGSGTRLCGGRGELPLGADRRALFPGQRRGSARGTRGRSNCRCCARISSSTPIRSSKAAISAPIASC